MATETKRLELSIKDLGGGLIQVYDDADGKQITNVSLQPGVVVEYGTRLHRGRVCKKMTLTLILSETITDLNSTSIYELDLPLRAHNRIGTWWARKHITARPWNPSREDIANIPKGPFVQDLIRVVEEGKQYEWLRTPGLGRMSVQHIEQALLKYTNGTIK